MRNQTVIRGLRPAIAACLAIAFWATGVRAAPPLHLQRIVDVPLPGGSSRLDYQSLDQARHLLFIAHLGASMVTVVNTQTNRVVGNIPNVSGVHSVLVVPELERVYASATDRNQVDVIDERTLRVLSHVPAGQYPDGIAYDLITHHIFVSDETGAADTVIDARTNRRVATIRLGGEAGNTQFDEGSLQVFVDVQTHNELVELAPLTNRIVGRYYLHGCVHDHGLAIDAVRRLAFVACDGNARLLLLNLNSMRVRSVASVGANPDVLAYDPAQHRVYVACESGILSAFAETGRPLRLRKIAEGFVAKDAHTVAVDPSTHQLYLPLQDIGGRPVLRVALLL